MTKNELYNCLFNVGEGIAFQHAPWDPEKEEYTYRKNRIVKWEGDIDNWNFAFEYYCVNPIHPTLDNNPIDPEKHGRNKPRATAENVTSIRNFAIEFDSCTLQEQRDRLKASKMPYSAIIFSGGKSLHTPIALEMPISQDEFDAKYACIERVLLNHGLKLDSQCKNVNRMTRAPQETNQKTGQQQRLFLVNGRIKNEDLDAWLLANGEDWTKFKKYTPPQITYDGAGDADEATRYQDALSSMKDAYGTVPRDPWFYKLAARCLDNGMTVDQIIYRFAQDFSDYDQPNRRDLTVRNAAKYTKRTLRTINMPKSQDTTPELDDFLEDLFNEDTPKVENRPEIKINYDQILSNYIMIGSKLYLQYPDRRLVEYNTTGFKARFPDKRITLTNVTPKYSSEGYRPDYFNPVGVLDNNMYNTFKLPDCTIEPGEWPMTKILIKHIFGEKFELGLEYYWCLRHRPSRALPALCLVGDEDAGKTTIAQHLEMCFRNTTEIDTSRLLQDENNYVQGHQIIVVEESSANNGKQGDGKKISDKIKILVTACGSRIPFKKLYDNATTVDYFGHIVLLTNDITPVEMKGEATRFWVREIKKPEKHERFVERLGEELGHFLWYLDNEFKPTRTESKERLWFHPSEYYTLAKERAKTESNTVIYRRIKDSLLEWFRDNPDEIHCNFDQSSLKDWVNKHTDSNFEKGQIKDCLVKEFGFGEPNPRKSLTDSLSDADPKNGLRQARKMLYWTITRDFKAVTTEDLYENLLNF